MAGQRRVACVAVWHARQQRVLAQLPLHACDALAQHAHVGGPALHLAPAPLLQRAALRRQASRAPLPLCRPPLQLALDEAVQRLKLQQLFAAPLQLRRQRLAAVKRGV